MINDILHTTGQIVTIGNVPDGDYHFMLNASLIVRGDKVVSINLDDKLYLVLGDNGKDTGLYREEGRGKYWDLKSI